MNFSTMFSLEGNSGLSNCQEDVFVDGLIQHERVVSQLLFERYFWFDCRKFTVNGQIPSY